MSMLADRKVKQRYSLNPRGKDWSEDANKIGQKLMEKMGWSRGKGLGKNEDGIVENLKVSYKNDSKGMGYKDSNDQWTEHDVNFNALLESLSGQQSEIGLKISSSLEKQSQSSRARLHYKKYTRGKDLSRCSEKDLANIFGRKTLKPIKKKEDTKENEKDSNSKLNSSSHFTFSGGSMVDYFKKKNVGHGNGYSVGSNGVLMKEQSFGFGFKSEDRNKPKSLTNGDTTPKKIKLENFSEDSNPRVLKKDQSSDDEKSFGFGFKSEDRNKLNFLTNAGTTPKKIKLETFSGDEYSNPGILKKDQSSDDEKSFGFGFKSKDRKKPDCLTNGGTTPKKIKLETSSEDGYSNPGFDPLFNNVVVQKHQLNTIEEEGDCKENDGHAFRENKMEKSSILLPSLENSKVEGLENETSLSFKSKKSKKRKNLANDDLAPKKTRNESFEKCGLSNPAFNLLSSETEKHDNVDVNNIEKKKKKRTKVITVEPSNGYISLNSELFEVPRKNKKVKKNISSGCDNSISDVCHSEDNATAEVENERKKNKKKKNKLTEGFDNEVTLSDESLNITNKTFSDNFEVKRKKKKKKIVQEMGLDNPTFDNNLNPNNSPVNNTFEIKRKEDQYAIDNPNLNISVDENTSKTIDDSEFDIMLNITTTPSQPKSNLSSSTSPRTRKQRLKRKSVRFSNVTEERIIPSNEDVENRNDLFDINSKIIERGLSSPTDANQELREISRKLDCFQAEIENDINEDKASRYIGEIGDPDGLNEKLPDGTKLKLKFAKFGRSVPWTFKHNESTPKSSYKHLIKGDIVLGFKNTNLHEIEGYGVNCRK